jgi:hypothetical protein
MRGINTQCIRQHLKKRQNGAPTFKKTFEKGHFPAGRRGSEKCDQQHSGEKRLTRGQSKTSDLQGKIQVLAPKARLQAIFRQTSNGHSQFGKTSSLEDAKEWNKKHPRKTKTSELKAGPSGGATASSGTASGAAPPVPMTPTAGPSPGGAAALRATTPGTNGIIDANSLSDTKTQKVPHPGGEPGLGEGHGGQAPGHKGLDRRGHQGARHQGVLKALRGVALHDGERGPIRPGVPP